MKPKNTIPFSEILEGDRFRYNCMFFIKINSSQAACISDDKFEAGLAKFMPNYGGKSSFGEGVFVQPLHEGLLVDSYVDHHISKAPPFREDWPAGKHAG